MTSFINGACSVYAIHYIFTLEHWRFVKLCDKHKIPKLKLEWSSSSSDCVAALCAGKSSQRKRMSMNELFRQEWNNCGATYWLHFRKDYSRNITGGTMSSGLHLFSMLYVKHADWVKGEEHALTLIYEKSHQYIVWEKNPRRTEFTYTRALSLSFIYFCSLRNKDYKWSTCRVMQSPSNRKESKFKAGKCSYVSQKTNVHNKHAFLVTENNMNTQIQVEIHTEIKIYKKLLLFFAERNQN